MHQNIFGGQAPPRPAGELIRYTRPISRNEDLLLMPGKEGERSEPTYKGEEEKGATSKRGGRERKDGTEREG